MKLTGAGNEMEKEESTGVVEKSRWWGAASAAQLGWAIWMYRKGCANASHLMPFKAFTVASLFVGAGATAAMASLRASGVHSVEDMKTVGANIRTGLGLRNRARDE